MTRQFLRRDYYRYSRLGKGRKKIQKWRSPKGIHSKMRRMREGYPASPSVGYKSPKASRRIKPVLVHNLKEMNILKKGDSIIIAKIGAKKRVELIKKAAELGTIILNMPREDKE